MKDPKSAWFPARRHGWGWGLPVRWPGWVALVLYLGLMIGGAKILNEPRPQIGRFVIYSIALSGAFVFLCWSKGGRPRWRRGGRN